MLKKANKYIALSTVCMLTISACSTDEGLSASDNQNKTPIELSAGVVGESPATQQAATRTTVASGTGSAFSKTTSVYMVLKSENSADATADALYTRTIGYIEGNSSSTATNNDIKFASGYNRYWEDSYSRNSQVSAYAACVPGYYLAASTSGVSVTADSKEDATTWTVGGSSDYENVWNTSDATTLAWPLRNASVANQTGDFVNSQDLCFSNNVSNLSADSRLTFSDETKKFSSGNLVFNHALTRVTFKIKKGDGFTTSDPFAFSNDNENIVIKAVNTKGTFDFKEGEFESSSVETGDIKQFAVTDNRTTDGATYAYELSALLVPGSDLSSTTAGQIYFTIDNNLYQLSKSTLVTALASKTLSDGSTPALDNNAMRPGVHYVFTMTVGKKKVSNFTASVVEWETVTAEETTPTNARITMTLLENGTKKTGTADFDLYRSEDINTSSTIDDNYESYEWETGYTPAENKAQLVEHASTSGSIYSAQDAADPHTDWYWPDNKTFYHFRAVMPKMDDTWKVIEDTNGDYITLAAGFSGSYKDVCWGAPFAKTDDKLNYGTASRGFDGKDDVTTHQLYKAIGPTEETINMIMFHMMSDVTIKLTTTTDDDQVDLTNAKMQLSNIYSTGKVLMGNGLVVPTETAGIITNVTATADTYQTPWTYGFIPQSLENVVLTITTTDGNLYIVNMEKVLATVGDNIIANPYTKSGDKYIIDRWLPNYQYTYKFKLTKAGISKISASLADWEKVEAGDDNVQIQ